MGYGYYCGLRATPAVLSILSLYVHYSTTLYLFFHTNSPAVLSILFKYTFLFFLYSFLPFKYYIFYSFFIISLLFLFQYLKIPTIIFFQRLYFPTVIFSQRSYFPTVIFSQRSYSFSINRTISYL